jgi:hypothetical protein
MFKVPGVYSHFRHPELKKKPFFPTLMAPQLQRVNSLVRSITGAKQQ